MKAEISAQSSVFSLPSLSVHLDPQSLLGLTNLVAAFLDSIVTMALVSLPDPPSERKEVCTSSHHGLAVAMDSPKS